MGLLHLALLLFLGGFTTYFWYHKSQFIQLIDYILSLFFSIKLTLQKEYQSRFTHKGFKLNFLIFYDENHSFVSGAAPPSGLTHIDRDVYHMLFSRTNHSIYRELNVDHVYREKKYIKFCYQYDEKKYILVYDDEMAEQNIRIPLPFYDEERIANFRNDIFEPYYMKHSKDASLYSLFHIDCKRIKSVKYNGVEDSFLLNELCKYQGLFNDFGILYQGRVKVKHILHEDQVEKLKSLEIEFEAPYFDEDTFDIIPHKIVLHHGEDIIISERMKSILERRNREEKERVKEKEE